MKLLLLAFGSRGDVQPLLPLGEALRAAGYAVQLAAGSNFIAEVEARGLDFVDVGIDIEALMNSTTGKEWVENSSASPLQEARNMKRMFDENTAMMGDEILRISQEPDVLISNLPTFGVAHTVASMLGKRHIRIMLAPLTPSTHPDVTMVPMVAGRNNILNRLAGYSRGDQHDGQQPDDAKQSCRTGHANPSRKWGRQCSRRNEHDFATGPKK